MPIDRREFLLTTAGAALGKVFLPATFPGGESTGPDLSKIDFLTLPKKGKIAGRITLMWMEVRPKGPVPVLWAPTPEEMDDALAFYEAARRADGIPKPPTTLTGKAARWITDFFGHDYRQHSPEEWQLINAIVAAPDDLPPLLAYADWLTAQGHPQGEFIYLELATQQAQDRDPDLIQRWNDFWEKHEAQILAPLKQVDLRGDSLSLRRGVITNIKVEESGILPERLDDLFLVAPLLEELDFHCEEVALGQIVQHPKMSQVRAISFNGDCQATTADVQALGAAQHLTRLRKLDLKYLKLDDDAAAALGAAPFLGQLTELILDLENLSAAGFRSLLSADRFHSLRVLGLADHKLSGDSLRELSQCASLAGLQELHFGGNKNARDGWGALSTAAFVDSLRLLDLGGVRGADPDEVRKLAAGSFPQLAVFRIGGCRQFPHSAVEALVAAPWFARLTELDLSSCELTPESVELLIRVPFQRLEKLDVGRTELGDDLFVALVHAPWFSRLHEVSCNRCGIGSAGVAALSQIDMPQLKDIRLRKNEIGPEGARHLLQSKLPSTIYLWVDEDQVGDAEKELLEKRFEHFMI